MNNEIDLRRIILTRSEDWIDWLFLRKDSADRNNLWRYVNPDLSKDAVKKQGKEPVSKTVAELFPNATRDTDGQVDVAELTEAELSKYSAYLRVVETQWTK